MRESRFRPSMDGSRYMFPTKIRSHCQLRDCSRWIRQSHMTSRLSERAHSCLRFRGQGNMRLGTTKRVLGNDPRGSCAHHYEHIGSSEVRTSKKRIKAVLQMALCVALSPPFLYAEEMRAVPAFEKNQANGPLAVSEVVAKLVAGNAERAKALESYTGRRTYRLEYHGFPGNLQSEMIVTVIYRAPSTKKFTVISEKGSKLIIDRVFHKLLEGEEEALNVKNRQATALNEVNYEFTLIRFERTLERSCYVLA